MGVMHAGEESPGPPCNPHTHIELLRNRVQPSVVG